MPRNLMLTALEREFSLRHPEVRDVCDIGQLLFWNYRWAWWFTAVMFVLNNTFIQVRSRLYMALNDIFG